MYAQITRINLASLAWNLKALLMMNIFEESFHKSIHFDLILSNEHYLYRIHFQHFISRHIQDNTAGNVAQLSLLTFFLLSYGFFATLIIL